MHPDKKMGGWRDSLLSFSRAKISLPASQDMPLPHACAVLQDLSVDTVAGWLLAAEYLHA